MSEISAKDGRVPRTTNMVLSDESQDWRELDEKVNTYPCVREIKAIGLGGDEFAADVKRRVEEVRTSQHVTTLVRVFGRGSPSLGCPGSSGYRKAAECGCRQGAAIVNRQVPVCHPPVPHGELGAGAGGVRKPIPEPGAEVVPIVM
eukprot:scaffold2738_cov366-Prasinococcus_capsulatus_cf.AAC.13